MTDKPKYFQYLPDHSTWDEFNGNLFLTYGDFNIIRSEEAHWQDTAQDLCRSFAEYPVPGTEGFEHWQDWARAFIVVVNGAIR